MRIGVIGPESVSEEYVPRIRRLNVEGSPCEVVIACDLRPGLAELARDWAIPAFTTDYRDALARSDVDVALVLTAMQSHGQITRDALNAGKHVLVEKPMSIDLAEAAELVALAQVSKSHLVCPPNVALSLTYQDMWRHIQAGDIGQPLSACGLYGWSGPNWGRWFYEPGGGPMYDLGVYNVTTLTGLLGPCRWVMSMTGLAIPERMVDNRKITVQTDDKIHQPVFGLPPGAGFRHSESFRTVFAAAEVQFVLMGTMVICNPETGETHLVQKGESVFFQKDTWHHAYAWGDQELRVLEYFAPPPSTGSSGKYAATRPYVSEIAYERRELIGHWPVQQAQSLTRAFLPQSLHQRIN